jgi:hypothetical protein
MCHYIFFFLITVISGKHSFLVSIEEEVCTVQMGVQYTSKESRFIDGLCGIQAESDGLIERLQFGYVFAFHFFCII